VSELTLQSMHEARDAEDRRLLEAGEYGALVESYYGVIVKRCQARTRTDGEAFDVASEVVVRLLAEVKSGKRYAVPFRVVVHKVIGWKLAEHFAARSNAAELVDGPVEEPGFDVADERNDLIALLDGLPPRERDVALLRILGALNPAEIALKLGVTRNSVDQAWHRAKAKLRESLQEVA
jgi:RNA polymerase sigma-70 factor, ECF subfamily